MDRKRVISKLLHSLEGKITVTYEDVAEYIEKEKISDESFNSILCTDVVVYFVCEGILFNSAVLGIGSVEEYSINKEKLQRKLRQIA